MIVTIEDIKAHLNVTFDRDDALIAGKIAAAQAHVEKLLGFAIEDEFGGEGQAPIPAPLVECVRQLAAWWYSQREAVIVGVTGMDMPDGFHDIIREYRCWSF